MRSALRLIAICLLAAASGCACVPSPGEPIDNPARRVALLAACPRPDVRRAVFRTLIRWPGREVSLTEVVEVSPEGGFSVAGVTDIGTTLYAVQIDPNGTARVLSKSLPFSDRWLLDGLVAELLIPWHGPEEACRLYELPDGGAALAREEEGTTRVFLFDATGQWCEFRRLSGCQLHSRLFLEWKGQAVPAVMRIENFKKHYRAVRESVSHE